MWTIVGFSLLFISATAHGFCYGSGEVGESDRWIELEGVSEQYCASSENKSWSQTNELCPTSRMEANTTVLMQFKWNGTFWLAGPSECNSINFRNGTGELKNSSDCNSTKRYICRRRPWTEWTQWSTCLPCPGLGKQVRNKTIDDMNTNFTEYKEHGRPCRCNLSSTTPGSTTDGTVTQTPHAVTFLPTTTSISTAVSTGEAASMILSTSSDFVSSVWEFELFSFLAGLGIGLLFFMVMAVMNCRLSKQLKEITNRKLDNMETKPRENAMPQRNETHINKQNQNPHYENLASFSQMHTQQSSSISPCAVKSGACSVDKDELSRQRHDYANVAVGGVTRNNDRNRFAPGGNACVDDNDYIRMQQYEDDQTSGNEGNRAYENVAHGPAKLRSLSRYATQVTSRFRSKVALKPPKIHQPRSTKSDNSDRSAKQTVGGLPNGAIQRNILKPTLPKNVPDKASNDRKKSLDNI